MTKRQFVRRAAWVGIALCVVVLAFGLTAHLLSLVPGVTEANVRRIHIGMTAREVAAILGEPTKESRLSEALARVPGPMAGMGMGMMGMPGMGLRGVGMPGMLWAQPLAREQWEQWIETGRAGIWMWSDRELLITIEFDDTRQVCSVGRMVLPRREASVFRPLKRHPPEATRPWLSVSSPAVP